MRKPRIKAKTQLSPRGGDKYCDHVFSRTFKTCCFCGKEYDRDYDSLNGRIANNDRS